MTAEKRDYVADQAMRTLRKAGLSIDEAQMFVQNCLWQANDNPEDWWECDLSRYSRALPYPTLSQTIEGAFDWDDSPEGWDFWCDMSEKYARKERNAQAQS